jgi:hypothetical protein
MGDFGLPNLGLTVEPRLGITGLGLIGDAHWHFGLTWFYPRGPMIDLQ